MCENEANIKPMPLPISRKGVFGWSDGVNIVKLNFCLRGVFFLEFSPRTLCFAKKDFFFLNFLFYRKFHGNSHFYGNCPNSLSFEAKIHCNTIKENCLKCRAKCTGIKLDLGPFNGPQRGLQFHKIRWWPCSLIEESVLFCQIIDQWP